MTDTIALSDLRSDLPDVVKQVADGLKRFVVTVSGKPKAVLISADELESLEETAEVMATVDLKALNRGLIQAKKKLGIPLDEL